MATVVRPSFLDIMAEQAAASFEVEVEEEELDADLLLAIELSKAEAEGLPGADADYQLARQMQEQESDREIALALQNQLTREEFVERLTHPVEHSKVSFSAGGSLYYDLHLPKEHSHSDSDEDSVDSEDEEITSIVEQKRQVQLARTGRVNKDSFMSKHDADLCGAKNARQIEKFVSTDTRNIKIPNKSFNQLKEFSRQQEQRQIAHKGKEDRETKDQVLDQKTRLTLLKLLNKDLLSSISGIISTGKEAVVYHGLRGAYTGDQEAYRTGLEGSAGREAAIKIFKVTLNEFKNRSRYIEGEWRFRRQPSTQNPRKLIKLWCEKEMRNLLRMYKHGATSPVPYHLEDSMLVMEFIGTNGVPAPKLKDVDLSPAQLSSAYLQILKNLRLIYHRCNLVHGDLSEYNMLYFKKKVYIIDVSQAVETDHPEALQLLRSDCTNVTEFFCKRGLDSVLTNMQLFDFVTAVGVENEEEYLAQLRRPEATTPEIQDEIFNNTDSFIPRRMGQVDPFDALASPSKLHVVATGLDK